HVAAWWREALSFGMGIAVAASLMLALPPSGQESMIAGLVDDHVRSLQQGHLIDVASSDQHTVKPWFDGRLDFAPPVKDLAPQGFPLVGGRLDSLAGRAVAALVYGRAKHFINLVIAPESGSADRLPASGERKGYNFIHWTKGGMSL